MCMVSAGAYTQSKQGWHAPARMGARALIGLIAGFTASRKAGTPRKELG